MVSNFKVYKYRAIMLKVELSQKQLDIELEMKEKMLEELKL